MKALSIRQPWADLIIYGPKRVENRSRRTKFRGRILVHAPIHEDAGADRWLQQRLLEGDLERARWASGLEASNRGGFIGVADIVDCIDISDDLYFTGPFGWVLANPIPVEFIPYRGRLGLFNAPDSIVEGIKI